MEKYTDFSKKLGRGSFGSVKLVQRNTDKKLLAMKVIELAGEETAKNACNETNILEKLQHPNIVKFYETFVLKESLYLVMEYCEEGDLQKKIKEAQAKEEYFFEEQVLEWFTQICLAVKMLHDNHVIHRDIKIHNTFLTSNGLVKLGDFGISKQLESTGDMGTTWLGTPFYVSPEMLSHSTSSKKSDMWMLGCLLHELCSLEKPFSGDNIPTVIRKILFEQYAPIPEHYSNLIHNLVARLLDKNAENRPSVDEILAIPEIKDEVEKLREKYPESYKDEHIFSSLKSQPTQGFNCAETRLKMKRCTSEVPGLDREHQKETDMGKDIINLSLLSNTWDLKDAGQEFNQGAGDLLNKKETPKPPLPDTSMIKRKSNNIRALVEQKKATLSPSNAAEKSLNISSTNPNPHQSFTSMASSLHIPTSTHLIKPIRIPSGQSEEAEPTPSEEITLPKPLKNTFKRKEDQHIDEHEEAKFEETSQTSLSKTLEGSKKPHHLSINIPSGPEQNENHPQPKAKKEKAKPATLKSPLNEISDSNAIPTTKVGTKKGFSFSQYLFDQKAPVSPNRSFWVSQFLKQKLGDEKFEGVRDLLENHGNPTQLLKEHPERVLEIIGEENRDCLMMLNFLISHNANSVTPTGDIKTLMDKSTYLRGFENCKSTRSYRSPHSANPFLRNVFPCNTEPDVVVGQGTIDDIRSARRVASDVIRTKEKGESPCTSVVTLSETGSEIN